MFKNLNPGMIGIHASLAEAMDMAAQYGFDGVDVNLPDVAELVRETSVGEVRDLFARAGCRPGNWGLPIEWHGGRDQVDGRTDPASPVCRPGTGHRRIADDRRGHALVG